MSMISGPGRFYTHFIPKSIPTNAILHPSLVVLFLPLVVLYTSLFIKTVSITVNINSLYFY